MYTIRPFEYVAELTFPTLSYSKLAEVIGLSEEESDVQRMKQEAQTRKNAWAPIKRTLVIVKDENNAALINSLSSALGIHKFNSLSSVLYANNKINSLVVPFAHLHEIDFNAIEYTTSDFRVALVGSFFSEEITLINTYLGGRNKVSQVLFVDDPKDYVSLINTAYEALPKREETSGFYTQELHAMIDDLVVQNYLSPHRSELSDYVFENTESSLRDYKSYLSIEEVSQGLASELKFFRCDIPVSKPVYPGSFTHASISFLTQVGHGESHFNEIWEEYKRDREADWGLIACSASLTLALGLLYLEEAMSFSVMENRFSVDPELMKDELFYSDKVARSINAGVSFECFVEVWDLLHQPELQYPISQMRWYKKLVPLIPQLIDVASIYSDSEW